MITIVSKIEGYRRCGIQHSARPEEYPDNHFAPEELAILLDTPVLQVKVTEPVEVQTGAADPERESEAQPVATEPEQATQAPQAAEEPASEIIGNLTPEQLEKKTVAELKEMAATMGLTVPAKATKKELIGLIAPGQQPE